MEYIIILILCIVFIFILKFAFQVKIKNLKKVKEIGYDKSLNEITDKLPDNKEVCKEILQQLGNNSVLIEESDDKNNKLTYYSIMTNHIIIANIKDTFTRIQTIAHECIHSIQNRKTLLFNFIFSNIYLLYFFAICILTIFKVIKYPMFQMIILILLSAIYYAIRSYLETDAMTKAPYIAKEYMQKNGTLSKEEIKTVITNYEVLNKIGIPMTNFALLTKMFSKVMIYCVITVLVFY